MIRRAIATDGQSRFTEPLILPSTELRVSPHPANTIATADVAKHHGWRAGKSAVHSVAEEMRRIPTRLVD